MRSTPGIPAFSYGVLIRGREDEKVAESVIFRKQNNCRNQHFLSIEQILINSSKFPVVIWFNRLFFRDIDIQKTHFPCSIRISNFHGSTFYSLSTVRMYLTMVLVRPPYKPSFPYRNSDTERYQCLSTASSFL